MQLYHKQHLYFECLHNSGHNFCFIHNNPNILFSQATLKIFLTLQATFYQTQPKSMFSSFIYIYINLNCYYSNSFKKDDYTNRKTRTMITSSLSRSTSTTSIHVTALDGLVNVNSLFTIAVFVGLSLTTPGQRSLQNQSSCDADITVVKKLLVYEVISFSFFLFSSLVAQGLKLAINLLNSKDVDEVFRAHINLKALRFGMLGSAVGSVMGCLFLMLSMVNVIEIRLGMLSCGSRSTMNAVVSMVVLVTSALLVYISTAVYAFLH